MQYKFSPKLKMASLALIVVGAILYGIGFYFNSQNSADPNYITDMIEADPQLFYGEYQTAEFQKLNNTPEAKAEYMHHLQNQVENRPWAALMVPAFYAFGIGAAALFFLCIMIASHSGWSIVVTRVMEGVATFIPVGGVIMLIIMVASYFGLNHMYHWMDPTLTDPNHANYDVIIASKSKIWLNSGWLIRSFLYVILFTAFMVWLKRSSRKLDELKGDVAFWNKHYNRNIYFIVVFALLSMAMAWDWVMSLDPHWYSTVFMWYGMVSYLVAAISIITIIAIYLNKKGSLPLFNAEHQHDLAKYIFGFSLVWTYLWFIQFMLQWYANIPEEVQYFQQRNEQYPLYYWMLAVNFVLVLLVMTSSSIKRVSWVVLLMGSLVIIGHYWDFYNQIMPATVGAFHNFGLLEIGALLFMAGLFVFVVFEYGISKLNLEASGNPLMHESKIFEYPY